MLTIKSCFSLLVISLGSIGLCACSNMSGSGQTNVAQASHQYSADYASRLPQHLNTGEKTVLVDPNVSAFVVDPLDRTFKATGDHRKIAALDGADCCW